MIDEKKLIEEIEKIFETDEQNIDCTLSDFAYHVFDCIKAQPKFGEWIPCSERLPEKEGKYLVTLDKWNIVSFADFKNIKCNPHFNAPVIAWMLLPEPYKGE